MLSYWEQSVFLSYDVIVVGAGIVGLSTAAELKEQAPKLRVAVVDENPFPRGATVRNAGFACFGSMAEICYDLDTTGVEATVQRVADRWEGLQLLRKRLGDSAIDYQLAGGHELLYPKEAHLLGRLGEVNKLLEPIFHTEVFLRRDELIKAYGFNPISVKHLIANRFEGNLHSGRMAQALLAYAREKGVALLSGVKVLGFDEQEDCIRVLAKDAPFEAKKVIVAANGFTHRLLPELHVKPGRGQVIVTAPIPKLRFSGNFHFEAGFYYFRNLGNRILFGGGRNLDLKGEETDQLAYNFDILEDLEDKLHSLILNGQKTTIEHRWAGIMGFSPNKTPIVKALTPRLIAGVGMNGMGVALGSKVGKELCRLALE